MCVFSKGHVRMQIIIPELKAVPHGAFKDLTRSGREHFIRLKLIHAF